jgi:type I restriction-modification system DNA methylase subunit
MNTEQARAIVKETFPQAFDKSRFQQLVVNLLNRIDESKAQAWNSTYIKDAFKDHIKGYERLGTYTSPDKEKLDVLIVHLTAESKLERARTAIRNFVADHLKTRDGKDAALVAFISPTEKQWRFSYVKMEYAAVEKEDGKVGVQAKLTPARRSSYIVGENESCHTAQSRFLDLLQDTENHPTLAQIEDAFSVEAVTKEFFEQYKELFLDLKDELDSLAKKDKIIGAEFADKNVSTADFAKKLMGQIVFLYFLQKKGWLGVPKGKDWGDGPHNFLRQLFAGKYGGYKNFFNDILEPLFYDTLATDRGHDAWCKIFNCRIPFLNGGLFEPVAGYDWQKTNILIPNSHFSNSKPTAAGDEGTGILDVFDRYNFTVNEAEPLEKEVAIDPEMLGKVFENLLEVKERKSKGSFYTPREIVHYMCQESLINYLDTAVNSGTETVGTERRKQALFGDEKAEQTLLTASVRKELIPRADLETFIHSGDQASYYEAARVEGTSYQRKLPKTIETNAKLLDDKLADIAVCDPAIGSGAFPVGMMQEIVRARSALTPYFNDVQERTAYHFKRHAIQNCIYGVDIDPGAVEIAKLRLWLSLVVDEDDVKQIKPLPNLDYKVVVGNSLLGVDKNELENWQAFHRLEEIKPKFFDEAHGERKHGYKREIDGLIHQLTNGKAAFDFEIYFSEVFHRKKGFDVVIGNPPYVSVEEFARTALQAEWKRRFKTFAARGDIYCFFYEQGFSILRNNGLLAFISSNKFQRAAYGKGLRQLLASQRIRALVDFCELSVFAAATDPIIVIAARSITPAKEEFPVLVVKEESEFATLKQSLDSRGSIYKNEQLRVEGWSLDGGIALALVSKLRAKGTPLGDYAKRKIFYGIKTGLNEAFVIDRATRDQLVREDRKSAELIKPWIRGRDISRWTHEYTDLYIIVVHYGFHSELKKYPAILRHLTKYEKALKARGQCQTSRSGESEGQHHWLELDNNPSEDYIAAFNEPKIVFSDIGKLLKATFDTSGRVIGNTGYIITNPEASLLPILLSSVTDWYARSTFQALGDPWNGGRMRFIYQNMKHVPIPSASAADKSRLAKLAERATELSAAGGGTALNKVEREIDEIVYRLFDLNPAEIAHIDNSLANTRKATSKDDNCDEDE